MQLSLLFLASLAAAAPLPVNWGKAALIAGGVGLAGVGTYEVAAHISKKRKEKKLQKEMEEQMMLEAMASADAGNNGTETGAAASGMLPSNDETKTEKHPFVSLKQTPPFGDKNPMANTAA